MNKKKLIGNYFFFKFLPLAKMIVSPQINSSTKAVSCSGSIELAGVSGVNSSSAGCLSAGGVGVGLGVGVCVGVAVGVAVWVGVAFVVGVVVGVVIGVVVGEGVIIGAGIGIGE